MQPIAIFYISLSGNTEDFIHRLAAHIKQKYGLELETTNLKSLVKKGQPAIFDIDKPYFSFLPSYLEGGNGLDNGYQEILTTPLRRLIAHGENATYCLGIVGSGNRNFNKQFCLTAHQYAQDFGFPVLDEFELRGSQEDLERIGDKLVKVFQTATKIKGVAYVQN